MARYKIKNSKGETVKDYSSWNRDMTQIFIKAKNFTKKTNDIHFVQIPIKKNGKITYIYCLPTTGSYGFFVDKAQYLVLGTSQIELDDMEDEEKRKFISELQYLKLDTNTGKLQFLKYKQNDISNATPETIIKQIADEYGERE